MTVSEIRKGIENQVKDYAKSLGIEVVGVAGPDQLDGPPSTDVSYVLRGGNSCVMFAVPLTVGSIYDFFAKKNKTHHICHTAQYRKTWVSSHYLQRQTLPEETEHGTEGGQSATAEGLVC